MTDQLYDPPPPPAPPPDFDHDALLVTHYENDLAAIKPETDLVVVRNSRTRAEFGDVRIPGRQASSGVTYGWQHTALANDPPGITNLRPGRARHAGSFVPDVTNKYKLPTDFENLFFNGGRATSSYPGPGEQVFFKPDGGSAADEVHVTIPPRPTVTVQPPSGTPPIVSTNLDTVIYDQSGARFIIVWRATFPWEDRLLTGKLIVSE